MRHESIANAQRRLAIQTDTTIIDLVVSASVPVGALIPPIVEALADMDLVNVAGLTATAWQLVRPVGDALDGSKTLSQMGIRDGCTLLLVRSPTAFATPPSPDPAEAVAATIAQMERPWSRRARCFVGVLIAVCLAGVTAAVLIRTAFDTAAPRIGCVGVAATAGLVTLSTAAFAYRVYDKPGLGLASGLMGTGFVALAGLFTIPGGPGASNILFGAAAAATAAALLRVIVCHTVVFTALTCISAACASAAAVRAAFAAPLPAIGAGVAAISMAAIEAAAPLSVAFARLSPVHVGVTDHVHARTISARAWLNSVIAAFSVSSALGAISAACKPSVPGVVFAAAAGGVLMLRARPGQDIARSVPPIVCGAVTLCAVLVAAAVTHPRHALLIAALSTALSITALYLGFLSGSTATVRTRRRSVELMQYFALAAIAPLALWLVGLYGAARSLNVP